MTLKALYDLVENGTLQVPVIGVGRKEWTDDELDQYAREAINARHQVRGTEMDEDVYQRFDSLLSYVQGDYMEKDTYERIKKKLGGAKHPVFYLEIPPGLFEPVIEQLG